MPAITPTSYITFFLPKTTEGQQVLTATLKTAAVALACIPLLGAKIALICGGITFVSEIFFRGSPDNPQTNWFNTKSITIGAIGKKLFELFVGSLLISLGFGALRMVGILPLAAAGPVQRVVSEGMKKPLEFAFKAIIQAPIVEEILFRGFLQERLEDIGHFFSKTICPIPRKMVQKIANVAQAIFFGYCHIIGGQVIPAAKWLVMAVTGYVGYVCGEAKRKYDTLLIPMALHGINNAWACAGSFFQK